jgi:hypothetical protein
MHPDLTPEDIERFWSLVDRSGGDDSCWPFTIITKSSDYGRLNLGGGVYLYAHRLAYVLTHGEIPEDRPHILHTCDNPPCANPAHLIAGTQAENIEDMVKKGRRIYANPFGEQSFHHILTEDDVRAIREEYARGNITQRKLGARYGVTPDAIRRVVKRQTWAHVH